MSQSISTMTRTERIVAFTLALEALKHEQRIDEWLKANPNSVYWSHPSGGGKRACTVVRNNQVVARSVGANDEDARAHAFSLVFMKEAEGSL